MTTRTVRLRFQPALYFFAKLLSQSQGYFSGMKSGHLIQTVFHQTLMLSMAGVTLIIVFPQQFSSPFPGFKTLIMAPQFSHLCTALFSMIAPFRFKVKF